MRLIWRGSAHGPGDHARLGRTGTRLAGQFEKKMRPQAGEYFNKSGARRTRQRPRAGALPGTMRYRAVCSKFLHAPRVPRFFDLA